MHSRIMSRPAGGVGISILAVVLFLIVGLVGATAQVDDPVVINEVLADPASDWDGDGAVDFKGDEWIEVLNNGTEPVNLADYWLRDAWETTRTCSLSGVLDPGETAVFYGSEAVAWQQRMGMTTSGFSLNNGGDLVQLLRAIHGPDGSRLRTDVRHLLRRPRGRRRPLLRLQYRTERLDPVRRHQSLRRRPGAGGHRLCAHRRADPTSVRVRCRCEAPFLRGGQGHYR